MERPLLSTQDVCGRMLPPSSVRQPSFSQRPGVGNTPSQASLGIAVQGPAGASRVWHSQVSMPFTGLPMTGAFWFPWNHRFLGSEANERIRTPCTAQAISARVGLLSSHSCERGDLFKPRRWKELSRVLGLRQVSVHPRSPVGADVAASCFAPTLRDRDAVRQQFGAFYFWKHVFSEGVTNSMYILQWKPLHFTSLWSILKITIFNKSNFLPTQFKLPSNDSVHEKNSNSLLH